MKPLELVRRAAGKSPAYLARRAVHEARRRLGARAFRARLGGLTAEAAAASLGAPTLEDAWRRSSAARIAPSADERGAILRLYETRFADEAAALRAEAGRVLAHTFDLLGSGPVALGAALDWHVDFKTGLSFPKDVPSESVDYARLDEPCDVKVPWELSRAQHLPRLAQWWVLDGDPRAPREFEDEVRAWIGANPPGYGVNWACTMDVALRAVSWIWALALFEGALFSPGFREAALLSLWQHALWVPERLEIGEVNGNHYLSDVVGQIALGAAFDAAPAGARLLEDGARRLEEEILRQSTPDGAGIEGSVPYHRLVVELFLVGRRFLVLAGRRPAPAFDERLQRMLGFVEAYVTPDGLSPVVGDADDGRALVLGSADVRDHRALLSTGAALFGRGSFRARAGRLYEETVWQLGASATAVFDAVAPEAPRASETFPDGGFYVLRNESQYLFVDAGPVGFLGRGGHGHNDCLSFEWHALGRPLLTDSGAYVYTASPEWRNRFRSTAFHNAIRVDGEEINRFPSELSLWSLRNDAVPSGVVLDPARGTISGSHSGYRRLAEPVTVTRRFEIGRAGARLVIGDRLDGSGTHAVEFLFHAAPGAAGRESGGVLTLEWPDGFRVSVSGGASGLSWERREGWFSPSYGVKAARETWVAAGRLSLPGEARWELEAHA